MMFRTGHFLTTTLVTLALSASTNAREPRQLFHNPFSRPPSVASFPQRSAQNSDGLMQVLDLRATMVASNDQLANVAGSILRPGDEFQGYTLLQVFEDRAVFARKGKRLTVYVNPGLEKDAE